MKMLHVIMTETMTAATSEVYCDSLLTCDGSAAGRMVIAQGIVDRFPHMTLSAAYDRVTRESAIFGDSVAFCDGDYVYVAVVTFDAR